MMQPDSDREPSGVPDRRPLSVSPSAVRAVQVFSNSAVAVQKLTRKSAAVFGVAGLSLVVGLLVRFGFTSWSIGAAILLGIAVCIPSLILVGVVFLTGSITNLPAKVSDVVREGTSEIKTMYSSADKPRGVVGKVLTFLRSTWRVYGASKDVRGLLGESAAVLRFANPMTAIAIGLSYLGGAVVTIAALIMWLVILL